MNTAGNKGTWQPPVEMTLSPAGSEIALRCLCWDVVGIITSGTAQYLQHDQRRFSRHSDAQFPQIEMCQQMRRPESTEGEHLRLWSRDPYPSLRTSLEAVFRYLANLPGIKRLVNTKFACPAFLPQATRESAVGAGLERHLKTETLKQGKKAY